jgi:hypothetical protein
MGDDDNPTPSLGSVESHWGKADADHFGYESDEDRKSKRGLEDWELVEKIPESQRPVPYWFFAVVVVVLLVVRMYGSSRAGRMDSDAETKKPEDER